MRTLEQSLARFHVPPAFHVSGLTMADGDGNCPNEPTVGFRILMDEGFRIVIRDPRFEVVLHPHPSALGVLFSCVTMVEGTITEPCLYACHVEDPRRLLVVPDRPEILGLLGSHP